MSKKLTSAVKKFFKKNGPLSQYLKNYNYRDIQEKMSVDISESINSNKDIIIEAGTGVGKTFAYLAPALLADRKITISTGTKTLQEQLYKKDIPIINKLIENPKQVVLLKGRRNYLCKYRLEQALVEETFETEDIAYDIKKISKWSDSTKDGDISSANNVNEKSLAWNKVTIGKDGCLNKDCPYFKNCFVMEIKKKAQNADVVIVNHHLLLSDWKLIKDDTDFLPKSNVIILDEAHQIPDLVHDYFGDYFASLSIKEFFKDTLSYIKFNSLKIMGLDNIVVKIDNYLNYIYEILSEQRVSRNNLSIFKNNIFIHQNLINIKLEIEKLKIILVSNKDNNNDFENYLSRADEFHDLINRFILFFEENKIDDKYIYWYEFFGKNFSFNITPIDISKQFSDIVKSLDSTMIYTSATISTNDSFDFFISNLGLNNKNGLKTRIYESPFDYKKQSIMYSPRNLPNPDNDSYTIEILKNILPILRVTEGRAFLLFTSYKALKIAAEYLFNYSSEFNLLIQGDMNKSDIINKFVQEENSLLLGTSTFWEGVDIKGKALQCVIIDKLPFASPFDPITQGKIKYLKSTGKDAFQELQCPKAAIALKQGAGRLIRDFNDFGVLVLADPRIVSKEYGEIFIKSLPKMTRTRDINKVIEFIDT